jgi:hypothetical protein
MDGRIGLAAPLYPLARVVCISSMKRRYVGKVERVIRRMLAEANAEPVPVSAVLRRAYPTATRYSWHWRSVWRAKGKFGVSAGRGWIGPSDALRRQIRGE